MLPGFDASPLRRESLALIKRAGLRGARGTDAIGDLADGAGALLITLRNLLRGYISVRSYAGVADGVTSNQAGLTSAVAQAYAVGGTLYWPPGANYVSTATIPNFHDIRHIGPGAIQRGSDVFYPDAKEGQQNRIYVEYPGDAANDGLSASYPLALQTALNYVSAAYRSGTWRVILAAGTYLGGYRFGRANESEVTPNTDSYLFNQVAQKNFISIEGPDVGYDPATNPWPVPTALFDGASAAAVGIQVQSAKVYVKNIKFSDYNGSTSSGGVIGDESYIRTENVHTSGCNYGLSNFRGRLEVRGGILYGSATKQYTGVRTMFLNKHEIGSQAAAGIGQGPKISFCSVGVLAQEGATGHCDSVSFEDCTDAIRASVNSRVNYSYSDFKRCTRAVRADANSVLFQDNANYNNGTADKNDENVVLQQGAVDVTRDPYSNTGVVTDYLTAPVTITGTTTSTAIITKTLARSRFAPVLFSTRKPQHIRVSGFGSASGTNNTKQIKMRIGATALGSVNIAAATTGSFKFTAEIVFLSSVLQRGGISVFTHLATNLSNYSSAAIDMAAADVAYQLEVQLVNAADSVTIDHCEFEVFG